MSPAAIASLIVALGALAAALAAHAHARNALAGARRSRSELERTRSELERVRADASERLAAQSAAYAERLVDAVREERAAAGEQLLKVQVAADERVAELLEQMSDERETWRSTERELLNRIQHPARMPVATSPVGLPPQHPKASPSDLARATWNGVGQTVPLNGQAEQAITDRELGSDVP
jgi:hypothetical protein